MHANAIVSSSNATVCEQIVDHSFTTETVLPSFELPKRTICLWSESPKGALHDLLGSASWATRPVQHPCLGDLLSAAAVPLSFLKTLCDQRHRMTALCPSEVTMINAVFTVLDLGHTQFVPLLQT